LAPDAIEELLTQLAGVEGLRVRGLMCIPPPAESPEQARPAFRQLRELRDTLRRRHPGIELLSMGMSDDFEVAIAEGSTHVRVGTALFGART
jgi:uncharacterized pyridoxal phosphate-containing UPF0001 family protein